ncbi:hypothetical protein BS47DRAFT_468932 [Hydnum rufescens UP504]|uniref:Uncharacterized protein n=1 Tax=Hydnum rufescens UP504 TaxID=1448309 RepID=A0A9P6B7D9_9AGAM|nr:hypothetical protein BS47DRAFT_468932 [Hydnum rufescens UP504]
MRVGELCDVFISLALSWKLCSCDALINWAVVFQHQPSSRLLRSCPLTPPRPHAPPKGPLETIGDKVLGGEYLYLVKPKRRSPSVPGALLSTPYRSDGQPLIPYPP